MSSASTTGTTRGCSLPERSRSSDKPVPRSAAKFRIPGASSPGRPTTRTVSCVVRQYIVVQR
jgi:hypothetical protein